MSPAAQKIVPVCVDLCRFVPVCAGLCRFLPRDSSRFLLRADSSLAPFFRKI
jgi:hypothetical protein